MTIVPQTTSESSSSEAILETGIVFSIEPGIYIPGRFPIGLEEIIILNNDGPEILSKITCKLGVINYS